MKNNKTQIHISKLPLLNKKVEYIIKCARNFELHNNFKQADDIDKNLIHIASNWDNDDDDDNDRSLGEWWLQDGNADYADSDVGDVNHEMLAEAAILNRLGFDLGQDTEYPITGYFANEMISELAQGRGEKYGRYSRFPDFKTWAEPQYTDPDSPMYENLSYEDYIRWLHTQGLPEEQRLSPEEVETHLSGFSDPRAHAIKHFGWARLKDNNVEIWDLSDKSLDNLANGLYDAYDDNVHKMNFNIEVQSLGKTLWEIPFSDIENKSINTEFKPGPVIIPRNTYEKPTAITPSGKDLYRYQGAKLKTKFIKTGNIF